MQIYCLGQDYDLVYYMEPRWLLTFHSLELSSTNVPHSNSCMKIFVAIDPSRNFSTQLKMYINKICWESLNKAVCWRCTEDTYVTTDWRYEAGKLEVKTWKCEALHSTACSNSIISP